jgi:hypothetical protein
MPFSMLVFFLPVKLRENQVKQRPRLRKIEFSYKSLPQLKDATETNLFQPILLAPAALYRQCILMKMTKESYIFAYKLFRVLTSKKLRISFTHRQRVLNYL